MPSNTTFADLYLYDKIEDASKKFIEFRDNLCGTSYNSNMNKIDRIFSSQNTSIVNINKKMEQIFSDGTHINADTIELKGLDYIERLSATYNAICNYSDNVYTLTLVEDIINELPSLFTIRFMTPNNFIDGSSFSLNQDIYSPIDGAFEANEIIIVNFDKSKKQCFFVGGGKTKAENVSLSNIPTLSSTNVQDAISEILEKLDNTVTEIKNGTIQSGDSAKINGYDFSYIMDYNNLNNKPQQSGIIVSAEQPEVSKTSMLWIDLSNNAIAKYSDGSQWIPIGSVWK